MLHMLRKSNPSEEIKRIGEESPLLELFGMHDFETSSSVTWKETWSITKRKAVDNTRVNVMSGALESPVAALCSTARTSSSLLREREGTGRVLRDGSADCKIAKCEEETSSRGCRMRTVTEIGRSFKIPNFDSIERGYSLSSNEDKKKPVGRKERREMQKKYKKLNKKMIKTGHSSRGKIMNLPAPKIPPFMVPRRGQLINWRVLLRRMWKKNRLRI